MSPEKPFEGEYSAALSHAAEANAEIAATDADIAEIRARIEDMKRELQEATDENLDGLYGMDAAAAENHRAQIRQQIAQAERMLGEFLQLRQEFTQLTKKLESLHKEGRDLLDGHSQQRPV